MISGLKAALHCYLAKDDTGGKERYSNIKENMNSREILNRQYVLKKGVSQGYE
ncbi:hypothetical protein ERICIV_04127 [Paenibacillus larvae subsp. larvae]|uniref:Uncharacterized protein n=1 Tax=Paenibacillus larvae subsp. larvae TaxID=147375 RepID=A0A2L1UJ30_9BACL|nr:hypothetical protein ERICIII_04384 [Paenibacillus larvae subsp. larvae]AVF32946.1 hypothetical protein ERICIV_04127 [Paenibacillus larvae subsp. larvae]